MRVRAERSAWLLLAAAVAIGLGGCTAAGDGEAASGSDDEPTPVGEALGDTSGFVADPDCFGLEPVGLGSEQVECGTVEVPRHYDEPAGETVEVAVAVLSELDAADPGQPLLLLGGGPGEELIELVLTQPGLRGLYAISREVVVMDQRGAGESTPALRCPEVAGAGLQATSSDVEALLADVADCRSRLAGEGRDLEAFNHAANTHDVEMVRRALGYEQLDVRAASYGAELALRVADRYPDGIRSLVLSSPLDPRASYLHRTAAGFERALDRVGEACAAEPRCADEVGELDAHLASVVERLAGRPEEVTVQPPRGEPVTVTYDPATFLNNVFLLFYLGESGVSLLPAVVDAAADGDLEAMARIAVGVSRQMEESVSVGMHLSMVCTGEGARYSPEAARAEIDSPLIAEHWFPASAVAGGAADDVCEQWDVDAVEAAEHDSLEVDAPTLLVTGAFDHVTPPTFGERLAGALPSSHLIEVPGAGHGALVALGPCGTQIAASFFEAPADAPDDSCATEREPELFTELPARLR